MTSQILATVSVDSQSNDDDAVILVEPTFRNNFSTLPTKVNEANDMTKRYDLNQRKTVIPFETVANTPQ